jgi:tRNA threonylcarbamoyladenosine biosynthesis protein TsaE
MLEFETNSAEETFALGKKTGEAASRGQVYALYGDLGVGKTVFAQGFGAGLGITEPLASPTFTILKEYEEGRLPLYHFDVYRIDDPEEMAEIGLDDFIGGEGVCLIGWADQIRELLPDDTVRVTIRRDLSRGEDFREIEIGDL